MAPLGRFIRAFGRDLDFLDIQPAPEAPDHVSPIRLTLDDSLVQVFVLDYDYWNNLDEIGGLFIGSN